LRLQHLFDEVALLVGGMDGVDDLRDQQGADDQQHQLHIESLRHDPLEQAHCPHSFSTTR
jgi:hypothetical protein